MLFSWGYTGALTDYLVNPLFRKTHAIKEHLTREAVMIEVERMGILEAWKSEGYTLGQTRHALNGVLTIDAAEGHVLSRPLKLRRSQEWWEAGRLLSRADIATLKWNCVNTVHVKCLPEVVVGSKLDETIVVEKLYRGQVVTPLVEEAVPQSKNCSHILKDTPCHITFKKGRVITKEILEILYHNKPDPFKISITKQLPREIRFEQEIIGNGMLMIKDFMDIDNIPEGLSGTDSVYIMDNIEPWTVPNLKQPTHLTVWDMLALTSLLCRAINMPDTVQKSDRDVEFLKRINLHCETFTDCFISAARPFIRQFKSAFTKEFLRNGMSSNPFRSFTDVWISKMTSETLLRPAEDLNPPALLSQAMRVASRCQGEVPNTMRMLPLAYFGRICPYETPAGKKIGIVNNIAVGCKIEDGIPLAPYRRVIKDRRSGRYRLGDKIEYISPVRQQSLKTCDLLAIHTDEQGFILDEYVTAQVPAPHGSRERVTVEQIKSTAIDYVTVHPDQSICSTAQLIPFIGSDDTARVTFGINLWRQSIYTEAGEAPNVITGFHRDIFQYNKNYCVRAKRSGIVTSLDNSSIGVVYDGDLTTTNIDVPELQIVNNCVIAMNWKVVPGDRFEEGDVLVDSCVARDGILSPGQNTLNAYVEDDGYNYEDGVILSQDCAFRFTSVDSIIIEKRIESLEGEIVDLGTDKYSQYIPAGGVICKIAYRSKNDQRDVRYEYVKAGHVGGSLYKLERGLDENKHPVVRAHLMVYSLAEAGDKFSGRHGNKGVQCLIRKNSEVLRLSNGRTIDNINNPCGVVSRMNIGNPIEGYVGLFAHITHCKVESDSFNGATLDDVRNMTHLTYDLCNLSSPSLFKFKWEGIFPDEFLAHCVKWFNEAHDDWEGVFDENFSAELFDPLTGTYLEYPVTIGMPYFLKECHTREHKSHVRAGIFEEPYQQLNGQPTHGASQKGGQAKGEMELECMAAFGAAELIWESRHCRSDNHAARTNLGMELIDQPPLYTEEEVRVGSKGNEIIQFGLEVLGINMQSDILRDISPKAIEGIVKYDPKARLRKIRADAALEKYRQHCFDKSKQRDEVDDAVSTLNTMSFD